MGLSAAFNDAAEFKERIYSELSGRTTPIGTLYHNGNTLRFEAQTDAAINLCAGYAAYAAAAYPDKIFQLEWQGRMHTIPAGMAAYDVAHLVTGQQVPEFKGTFTTRMRMPPEAVRNAIEGEDFGALRTCLQNNAFPDAVFDDGNTPLTLAVKQGKHYVELLIKHGANVNLPVTDGITPLMAAALEGDVETARVLLDAGADINAVDSSGRAARVHATNPQMKDFLEGPYPAEAAERIRLKKAEQEAAAATAATVLQRNVIPMSPLKLRKNPKS
jgi:hypothetical protein